MAKVKVTRKYQVTIPQEVREKTGLRIGDELLVREEEERIVIEKPLDIEKLAGSWDHIVSTEKFMEEARGLWKTWRLR
jgi:AbrB family looped-hinge helix DNA binding protein